MMLIVIFYVVGCGLKDELLECYGKDGCYVWGWVRDICIWLKVVDFVLILFDIVWGV